MIKSFEDLKSIENKQYTPSGVKIPWSYEVLRNSDKKIGSPSSLLYWMDTETAKKRRGEDNEIDIADIRAAFKGVRNGWSEAIKKNSEVFKPVSERKLYDWEKIMECKNG